jgi:hypothetical protein
MTDSTPEHKWEALTIVRRNILEFDESHVTLQLELSAPPDPEWAHIFENVGASRRGSRAFINGPGPVVNGAFLEWRVPEADMQGAWQTIDLHLRNANAEFLNVLWQRHEAAEKDAVRKAKRAELQRKLDSFS